MKRYHYVYYSYEEWGRGYIGVRSSSVPPEVDTDYFGSFTDKSFKPTKKIIIAVFSTREEAAKAEIMLHDFFDVHLNEHFANKAKAHSTKFWYGRPRTSAEKQKISKALSGRKVPRDVIERTASKMRGRKQHKEWVEKRTSKLRGKKRTEEQRKKISDSHKGITNPNLYKPVTLINNKTKEVLRFESQQRAVDTLDLLQSNFCSMIAGRRKSCGGYSVFKAESDCC